MKQDIAIYGGAFDPFHLGHARIAKTVSEQLDIPVWITPAAYHPFGKKMTDFEHRRNMIKLAIENIPNVSIAEHELRNYSGLTADLSALLRAEHPDKNFRIIMGEDNAQIIKTKWEGYERIIEHHPLIIMSRVGYPNAQQWYHEAPHVSVPWDAIEVSSSKVREILTKTDFSKDSAFGAVLELQRTMDEKVLNYIIDHELYAPERSGSKASK